MYSYLVRVESGQPMAGYVLHKDTDSTQCHVFTK